MGITSEQILNILDRCCDDFTFPILDNGYVYLAATRMSLFRSDVDWALVIEIFGFSPRTGLPDINIHTFASRLWNRNPPAHDVTPEVDQKHLTNHPHNESHIVYPIEKGNWQDPEIADFVSQEAKEIVVRGTRFRLPSLDEYKHHGIDLEEPPRILVVELCRYLADVAREHILATESEQRMNVPPELKKILQLEEWHHPNLVEEAERTSQSETFQQLAKVLVTGHTSLYQPSFPPNTHWGNWPEGGRL